MTTTPHWVYRWQSALDLFFFLRQRPEDFSYYNAEMTALKTCQTKLKFKSTRRDAMRRNFKAKAFQIGSVQICISIRTNVQTFFLRVLGAHVLESTRAKPQQARTQFKPKQTRETVARRANKPKKTHTHTQKKTKCNTWHKITKQNKKKKNGEKIKNVSSNVCLTLN